MDLTCKRNCPQCGKELIYKEKRYRHTADKKCRICVECTNKNKSKCKVCSRLISIRQIQKHERSCTGKIPHQAYPVIEVDTKFACILCNKIFNTRNATRVHYWRTHTDEGKIFRPGVGHVGWNRGLTKETSELVKKSSEKLKELYRQGKIKCSMSDAGRASLSKSAKERHIGGYKQKKWKNIQYIKNGEVVFFDSMYELRVAKSLDENEISWEKPKRLIYEIDGKKKRYFADFYLPSYNVYLDPKNEYLQKLDDRKINLVMSQNNVKIIVVGKNQLDWKSIQALIV